MNIIRNVSVKINLKDDQERKCEHERKDDQERKCENQP